MLKKISTGFAAMSAAAVCAGFNAAPVFSDHGVVQQKMPVPVWGTAAPGDRISCSLGKAEAFTSADAEGKFLLRLPPQDAGGPYELKIRNLTAGKEIVRKDIYVGEVWIASGQSNMEFTLKMLNLGDVIKNADNPLVRVMNFPGTGWRKVSPSTAPDISGTAYFFADALQKKLGVAVGVINNAVGGSAAEAWVSREALIGLPFYRKALLEYESVRNTAGWVNRRAAHEELKKRCLSASRDNLGVEKKWHEAGFDDSAWKTVDLPNVWKKFGYDFNGTLWFRKTVDLPAGWENRALRLNLGCIDKQDIAYFNGVVVGRTGKDFEHFNYNVPRSYEVPGKLVKKGRNVIAVRVNSFVFDGGLTGPAGEMALLAGKESIPLAGSWKCMVEVNLGKVPPGKIEIPWECNDFSVLFDMLTRPLVPYAAKGFIWYQGCSNAFGPMTAPTAPLAEKLIGRSPAAYEDLMTALIRDWRYRWGQGENMPFIQVQLAGFGGQAEVQERNAFAEIRNAQFNSARKTGNRLAAAYDIGEPGNVHPKNKREVGRRLMLAALNQAYGRRVECSGPVFESAVYRDSQVVISFSHAEGLHSMQKPLKGFALSCGGRYFPAEAEIRGRQVVVSCPAGKTPVSVRYAWAGCPVANLYNSRDLPAFPFSEKIEASLNNKKGN